MSLYVTKFAHCEQIEVVAFGSLNKDKILNNQHKQGMTL